MRALRVVQSCGGTPCAYTPVMTRRTRTLQHVVVATDFSAGAATALDRALLLPLTRGATLTLVHAISPLADTDERPDIEALARERLVREADRARAAALNITVATECRSGSPFVEIIRASRANQADLIVIGEHGARRFRDMFIGSTVSRVVRQGDTPVLVVKQPAESQYESVVVALSLADTDRRLLTLALQVGGAPRGTSIVHAVHVPFEGLMAGTPNARAEARSSYRTDAERRLAGLLAGVEGSEAWSSTVAVGDTRAIILGDLALRGADLLVVGTHGRSGLVHALVGSVAEAVIQLAPCDVLVARPARFSFELP
jgi:universal stress protein E